MRSGTLLHVTTVLWSHVWWGYSLKSNTDTPGQTKPWTQLFTSLSSFCSVTRVWPLGKNVVARMKKEIKRPNDPGLHAETLFSLAASLLHHLQCFAMLLGLFPLSVTWPLKESDEFTADSLWLRGAESSVGWHYRKWLHIDTKRKKRHKQKENTMAHFSQYKLLSAWITLMTPDKP